MGSSPGWDPGPSDDFLLLAPPASEKGAEFLRIALEILDHLGIPVASHKTEGPATLVVFLGILIDTLSFELRLPGDKLARLRVLLQSFAHKRSCTMRELESLLGHLSHAATVVRPGRTFLRQLFALLHRTAIPNHHIHFTAGARADLAWWRCFLQTWNGSSFFPLPEPSCHVFTDASGSWGCGAVAQDTGWLQVPWPDSWNAIDIAAKELVPVVLAAALWGPQWAGRHVRFHIDNMAVVEVLKTHTSRHPLMMHLLRCFAFYASYYRFHFSSQHIPGVLNVAADAISRNQVSLFSTFVSQVPFFHVPKSLENSF